MSSFRIFLAALIMPLILSSCRRGAVSPSPTAVSINTPQVSPTLEETPTPTRNLQWATYRNSFEDLSNPTASGFSGHQSPLSTSQSSLKINGDLAATGKQSLEVLGTISGGGSSSLNIDFPIKSLIGEGAIDFSETALKVSVYIPKNSALDGINFGFSSGGQEVIVPVLGVNVEKDRWLQRTINLRRVGEDPRVILFGISWQPAQNIIRNCDMVSLVGTSSSKGDVLPARFLVDDLSWADAPDLSGGLPSDPNANSLRKFADRRGLKIGSVLLAADPVDYLLNSAYPTTLAREFNLMSGAGSVWPETQPANPTTNDFDYFDSDTAVAFAQTNRMAAKGFAGGWHFQIPQWLLDMPFDRLQPILENRVAKDVGRYRGKVSLWDVFDEVLYDSISNDGNPTIRFYNRQEKNKVGPTGPGGIAPYGWSYSPWVDGNDTSLIAAAFRQARETDPAAELFLNDFDNEQIGQRKAEACYQFVKTMRQGGVPIDGVGFQLAVWIEGNTVGMYADHAAFDVYLDNVRRNVERYSALGVLVEFSEVEVFIRIDDIDLATPVGQQTYQKRLQDQAYVYAGLAKIAAENKNVVAFIFWTVSDPWSQTQTVDYPAHEVFGDPALFDFLYQPKPAYYAVLNVLKGK